jgi:hypothetical protein
LREAGESNIKDEWARMCKVSVKKRNGEDNNGYREGVLRGRKGERGRFNDGGKWNEGREKEGRQWRLEKAVEASFFSAAAEAGSGLWSGRTSAANVRKPTRTRGKGRERKEKTHQASAATRRCSRTCARRFLRLLNVDLQ